MPKTERDDHFMHELITDPSSKSGKTVKVTRPRDVLPISDVKELRAQLKHYQRPMIKLYISDVRARKFYITKVRPALRYYCHKFNVKIPDWLKDDSYYENLPDAEKQDLFGSTKLRFNATFKPAPEYGPGGMVQK